jgi:aspartate racemase
LDYVVFNDASVPDRTAYILGNSTENPVPAIIDDIHKATVIGASFIVLACNTEHYFFDEFQASTTVPILHMPRGAVRAMSESYPAVHVEDALDDAGESIVRHARVGFMGTEGSRVAGVYSREITAAEYEYIEPDAALQQRIDSLIYDDVKGGRPLNRERYESVVNTLLDPDGIYRCDIVLLGCTELSVLNEAFPRPDLPIIDAQAVLVEDTIKRARALRSSDI